MKTEISSANVCAVCGNPLDINDDICHCCFGMSKAQIYAGTMHMSKKAVYEQLVSRYGEKFSHEAALRAINGIQADWKANALEKAKSYRESSNMSDRAIFEQLISAYGEQFTKEEAKYAIAHLKD